MSHNIRSKTYMQVAARERRYRAQMMQVALALLVLLMILFWNQAGTERDLGASSEIPQQSTVQSTVQSDEPMSTNFWN